jgi:hypothetical protein
MAVEMSRWSAWWRPGHVKHRRLTVENNKG